MHEEDYFNSRSSSETSESSASSSTCASSSNSASQCPVTVENTMMIPQQGSRSQQHGHQQPTAVVTLPPLTLSHHVANDPVTLVQYLPQSHQSSRGQSPRQVAFTPGGAVGAGLSTKQTPLAHGSNTEDDLLAATKRLVIAKNAAGAPSRCNEEVVVTQRFGEHRTRIPTPPVHTELLLTRNSKEEKHFRNKMRIFGNVDSMNRVYAGGIATIEKPSPVTIRCDSRQHSPGGGSSRGRDSASGRGTATPAHASRMIPVLDQGPSLGIAYVDLKYFDHASSPRLAPQTPFSQEAGGSQPHPTVGSATDPRMSMCTPRSRCGGENHFFLVSRASHRSDHPPASSASARTPGSLSHPQQPTQPSSAREMSRQAHSREDKSSEGRGTWGSMYDMDDSRNREDTKYVVTETKRFERGSLANARKEWISTRANIESDLKAARTEHHTSDLLKMIFNQRIALECEIAQTLRRRAEEVGVEKFIADAVSTAQRLALRSAKVDDFHHFLCNLLRDPEISFSETRVIFNSLDANKSGILDASEVSEGLKLLLLDESQLVLTYGKKIFTEVGRHKDTRLSFLEVQAMLFSVLEFFEVEFSESDILKQSEFNPSNARDDEPSLTLDGQNELGEGFLRAVPSINLQQQMGGLLSRTKDGAAKKTKVNSLGPQDRKDSAMYVQSPSRGQSRAQSVSQGMEPSIAIAIPEKPTIENLKQRMVKEVSKLLREAWKYSQSGQIVIPLLRTLANSVAPIAHYAACHVPSHFDLKRSGFWKTLLAAEDTKYQQFLAQHDLDMEVDMTRRLSFGGGILTKGGRRGSRASVSSAADADLVKELQDLHKAGSLMGRKGTLIPMGSRLPPQHTGGAPGSSSGASSPRSKSIVAGLENPNAKRVGGRRQDAAFVSYVQSLASIEPISYEEYEEATGDTVNINFLQQQLKDGALRLSQAQRNLIVQQIEQGKAARLAAAAANQKKNNGGFGVSSPRSGRGKEGMQRNARVTMDDSHEVTPVQSSLLPVAGGVSGSATSAGDEPPRDELFLQSLSRRKSEKGISKGGAAGTQHAIDLNEVVDPWHPKFQADHNKISSVARQLTAKEHDAVEFFSKQGHIFTKTQNGIIVPLAGTEQQSP